MICSVNLNGVSVVLIVQLTSIYSSYSDSGLFGVQAVTTAENIGTVSLVYLTSILR